MFTEKCNIYKYLNYTINNNNIIVQNIFTIILFIINIIALNICYIYCYYYNIFVTYKIILYHIKVMIIIYNFLWIYDL